jgi:hypothetical protein
LAEIKKIKLKRFSRSVLDSLECLELLKFTVWGSNLKVILAQVINNFSKFGEQKNFDLC